MNSMDPNIRPVIRQLEEAAINRIAAGEVVERPASAVKELVENSIDAGASRISIDFADGGKTLIRVADDGCGISANELPLALSRHATSKIDGSDLLNIHTFGFRGEALPSLGSVGRLTITSRVANEEAAEILICGGEMGQIKPAALNSGTVITLRDLFFATPARLKFLRSDRAETQAILDIVKRLVMAKPFIRFELRDVSNKPRIILQVEAQSGDPMEALHARLTNALGADFAENSIAIDTMRENLHLTGYAGLPTYSRGAAVEQFFYVNGRSVKDKLLTGALRAAYFDFLSRGRHPAAVLCINCAPKLVDVNVHPAKSEVRFRDPGLVRGMIVSGLRHALASAGHRASSTVAGATLGAMQPETLERRAYQMDRPSSGSHAVPAFAEMATDYSARVEQPAFNHDAEIEDLPLGVARVQVHENYIVAQTQTGMVIVDQHAAHERLVYEKLKSQMVEKTVASQVLLIPEIVTLSASECTRLMDIVEDLQLLGLGIEPFGGDAIAVRETPAILGEVDAQAMIRDILDELSDLGTSYSVKAQIEAILSRVACHGSIRSGRRMRAEEMNALLREMEATPYSGQCNHGRPTYVELKLADIERLFGRT